MAGIHAWHPSATSLFYLFIYFCIDKYNVSKMQKSVVVLRLQGSRPYEGRQYQQSRN